MRPQAGLRLLESGVEIDVPTKKVQKLETLCVVLPRHAEEALMKLTKADTPQVAVERAVLMMGARKPAKPRKK